MVIQSPRRLDRVFRALGDPTRRRIIRDLTQQDRTVMDLARQFAISQPAVTKHLHVLERAGLIRRTREGRTRRCTLRPAGLRASRAWIDRVERFWNRRLDALERLLAEIPTEEE